MPGGDHSASDSASNSASECNRFDRKAVLPLIERRYQEIVKDIEDLPIEIIADLLSNPVGSDKALAAVKRAKEYATNRGTRFIVTAADLEALLDTFRTVEDHVAAKKGSIHPHMRLRGVTSKAADSKCPEYFTEVKVSQTTGLKELYVALRIGEDPENIIGVLRASKQANPY